MLGRKTVEIRECHGVSDRCWESAHWRAYSRSQPHSRSKAIQYWTCPRVRCPRLSCQLGLGLTTQLKESVNPYWFLGLGLVCHFSLGSGCSTNGKSWLYYAAIHIQFAGLTHIKGPFHSYMSAQARHSDSHLTRTKNLVSVATGGSQHSTNTCTTSRT